MSDNVENEDETLTNDDETQGNDENEDKLHVNDEDTNEIEINDVEDPTSELIVNVEENIAVNDTREAEDCETELAVNEPQSDDVPGEENELVVLETASPHLVESIDLVTITPINCNDNWRVAQSVYNFSACDLENNEVSLDKYRGKVLVIMNVASQCGLTEVNYKEMVEMAKQLEDKPFRILAFPCNQFAGQEPGFHLAFYSQLTPPTFSTNPNLNQMLPTLEETYAGDPDEEATYANDNWRTARSVYDFIVRDIHGRDISLGEYRGQILLIVNVASKCGLTEINYRELVDLHEHFVGRPFRILAFPCNQFAKQEPGTNLEVFCFAKTRNAEFEFFDKIDVNGSNTHPLWCYLKHQQGGILGSFIKWNFTKFIVDKNGIPVERHGPRTNPSDLVDNIEKYLDQEY